MANKHDIILKTRKKLFSNLHGEHSSIFGGSGLEFSDVREYNIDDDVRHINWKITARSGSPSVNVFVENKSLDIVLVYLNSGGLYFGSNRAKKDVALEVFTSLSYATVIKKDSLSSIVFDTKERYFFKPTKNKKVVDINFDTIDSIKPLNSKVDFSILEEYLLDKIKKKSIIFLVGDFLELPSFYTLGLKHELYCVIVRDRAEEDLKLLGEFNFLDTNSSQSFHMELDTKTINLYNKKIKEHDKKLYSHFKDANIKFEKIYTGDDVIDKLVHLTRV